MKHIAHMAGCVLLLIATTSVLAQHDMMQHDVMQRGGMVMNANENILPRDCDSISTDHAFTVHAGAEYAEAYPGTTFGYDQRELLVEPCSRVTVTFVNDDEVRHQWMVHGLPRYLYPGGMFHLEASGGASQTGSFIVPSDDRTYLVHCDLTQHMEKGMKAQVVVGSGSGDLWAIPGVSRGFNRDGYLPRFTGALLVLALAAGVGATFVLRRLI
ncbi:MAG: copper oxidase [Gammaproteobacteria bacterium]|nr:copper oxidase [Gammaproteobacteria bacterium]